jgi:uncharacterized protein (DUF58 family)
MNRKSTTTLLVGSTLIAVVAIVLTAVTGAGAAGAQGFLFGGVFVFSIFLLWPELRAFSSSPQLSWRRKRARRRS